MTNLLAPAQELARRFNEAEATHREFERLRVLRRLFAPNLESEKDTLDALWQLARNKCRQTRAFGVPIPSQS